MKSKSIKLLCWFTYFLCVGITEVALSHEITPSSQESSSSLSIQKQLAIARSSINSARPNNVELLSLGSISYIASVSVVNVSDFYTEYDGESVRIPAGAVATVEIERVWWAKQSEWNLGVNEPFTAPLIGSRLVLVLDKDWGIGSGDTIDVGVDVLTRLGTGTDGFVKYVVGRGSHKIDSVGGWEVTSREKLSPEISKLVDTAITIVRKADKSEGSLTSPTKSSELSALVSLATDADAWVDSSNRSKMDEPLRAGLLKQAALQLDLPVIEPRTADAARSFSRDAYRTLPLVVDELPGILDAWTGQSGLVEARAAIYAGDEDAIAMYAIRFNDVGVLGPFGTDADIGVAMITGVMPTTGRFEILKWPDFRADAGPYNGEVIFEGNLPSHWDVSNSILVFDPRSSTKTIEYTVLDVGAFDKQITTQLEASRGQNFGR